MFGKTGYRTRAIEEDRMNLKLQIQVPTYAAAHRIANDAGRKKEFTDYCNSLKIDPSPTNRELCHSWDFWRKQYPDIPSYRIKPEPTHPVQLIRNIAPPQAKTDVTWANGLLIATQYQLLPDYRSRHGFPTSNMEAIDSGFWVWADRHNLEAIDCHRIWDKATLEWEDFITECTEASHIRREMFDLNVQRIVDLGYDDTVLGDIEYDTLSTLNIPIRRFTEGNGDIWNRTQLNRFGGEIYAFISTRSGFFNAKPRCPMWDCEKGKYRKYEARRKNPGEEGNKVFFPDVDQVVCDRLRANFDIPLDVEIVPKNYWEVILSLPQIRVGITEGVKKCLALTDNGFPCVAILGVGNWSVSGSDPRVLLPELAKLCRNNRLIDIWFDQENIDEKIKAFLSVKSQANKLRHALIANGANIKSCPIVWDLAWGKGIDDTIAHLDRVAAQIISWLWETISNSLQRSIYHQIERAYRIAVTRPIYRDTIGNYLPGDIDIELGYIIALIADTGSGKTHQICQAIEQCRQRGQIAIVFAPTNKIGIQLAASFGIPHRNTNDLREDGSPMEQGDILYEARRRGGLVVCPDSIDWAAQLVKNFRQYVVICDEAAKIGEHLSVGTTIKDRYALVTTGFAKLLTNAQSIIIAEAKLSEADIQFYEKISGKPTRIYRHRRETAKREINMIVGSSSAIRSALLLEIGDRLERGERVVIPTDSQRLGEAIEHYLKNRFPFHHGRRVDAHTGYLPEIQTLTRTPNHFLAQHQLDYLIFSPACKAGWDLTGTDGSSSYHFDAVCAFFTVLPTSDHIQMIARYRPNVEVSIACPELISQSRDEIYQSTKALKQIRATELIADRQMCRIPAAESDPLQLALSDLYVHHMVRNGLEKLIARFSLHNRALDDGHSVMVTPISMPEIAVDRPDYHAQLKGIAASLTKISDMMDEQWSQSIANVQLQLTDDIAEATRLDRLENPTPHDRAKSLKIRLTHAFPGVNFSDFDNAHHSTRKHGKVAKGATLHASLLFEALIASSQRARNNSLLQNPIFANHHLSYDLQRVRLMLLSGILDLLADEYCKESPELIALQKRCVKYAPEFKRYLGLDINVNQDPTEIYNKLVRKLGLETDIRRDTNGKRLRWYRVANMPTIEQNIEKANDRCEQLQSKLEVKEAKLSSMSEASSVKAMVAIAKLKARIDRIVNVVLPRLFTLCTQIRVRESLFTAAVVRFERVESAINDAGIIAA